MRKRPCKKCVKCVPMPIEHGYYWATYHNRFGDTRRMIVEVRTNGFKQVRVFMTWGSSSYGLEEFTDWHGPLKESK